MGRSRRGSKEYTKEQQLYHENQQLKREVARLRKRLARIELEYREQQTENTITEYFQQDKLKNDQKIKQKNQDWACWKCKLGHLQIIIYNKPTGTFYFRKCNKCENRTESKQYLTYIE